MGENDFAPLPTAVYGLSPLMPALAWYLLQNAIIRKHGMESVLAKALGRDLKGKMSSVLYVAAIALAFVGPWISLAIYALVAVMWLIPDRRIEHAVVVES
jgi:uncharacterized membrane protein